MNAKARLFGLFGVALVLWLLASWFIADGILRSRTATTLRHETDEMAMQADNIAKNISRNLEYLHGIPSLIAQEKVVSNALLQLGKARNAAELSVEQKRAIWSADPSLKALGDHLALVATSLGANALLVLNTDGDSIAASNSAPPASSVGSNYADRAYFQAALKGKPGYQYAMGRTTNVPGLFFSAPVFAEGRVIGVAVAKINLPNLAHWVNQADAFVSDNYGIVILAHDARLEMRALAGGSIASLSPAERQARYKRTEFPTLALTAWGNQQFPGLQRFQQETLPLLMTNRSLPENGINLHVFQRLPALAAYDGERLQLFLLLVSAGAALLLAVSGGYVFAQTRKQTALETAQSLSLLRATIESTTDGILVVDNAGRVTTYNPQFVELLRIPAELLATGEGRPMLEFAATQVADPQLFGEHIQELNADPAKARFDILQFRDGRSIERSAFPQRLGDQVVGRVWSFRDITERKRAEQALAERELELRTIIETEPECVKVLSADSTLLRMNRAGLDMIDASSEGQVVGKKVLGIILPQYHAAFMALTQRVFEGESGTLEFEIRGFRGTHRWLETHAVPLRDLTGKIISLLGVTRDITQRKEAEAAIHNLAFYDPLTRLPNRRLLLDRLGQALAESARSGRHGALMFLDLDHFKTLNDTQGHDIGDLLLVDVAARLLNCIREGDSVARLGGDEFVVMLENLAEDEIQAAAQAEGIAEKIRETINQPYRLGLGDDQINQSASVYHCTSSIGISLFVGHAKALDDLLKRADLAMYEAKAAGRDSIRFYDPDMQAALDARARLEAELRHALAHREFQLYFQAQVDRDQCIVGAEALLRWNHPQRGLVAPAEFIAMAEETGLIVPIGLWVLETACAQLKAWSDHPVAHSLQLAINISPRQFRQTDFVEQVRTVLARTGVDASRLKLELTEDLLITNVADTIAKMQTLNELGLRFALDDFGTGYSSLAYLKRLPLDQLKIDKSFVMELEGDDNDAAICAATIGLAHTLGVAVVAEGVETEAQRHFLADVHHCDYLQGYLFGRPVPLQEFEQLLQRD